MKEKLKIAAFVLIVAAIIAGALAANYKIERAKFPDAPWWALIFK